MLLRTLIALLVLAPCVSPIGAQTSHPPAIIPFLRLEGGMLNPAGPFAVTMAYGAGLGVSYGRHSAVARIWRQSANRNSGPDLTTDARRFATISWEYQGARAGVHERQGILRLGLGRVSRAPYRSTWFLDTALALRYRLASSLALMGTLQYVPILIPEEQFVYCGPGEGPASALNYCRDALVDGRIQHNFGLLFGVEARLR